MPRHYVGKKGKPRRKALREHRAAMKGKVVRKTKTKTGRKGY